MFSVTIPEYESKDGKRIYPKDDYCLFCERKIKSKISDHYLGNAHELEPRVIEIRLMPLHSDERKLALQNLQIDGNFQHNVKVNINLIHNDVHSAKKETQL